MRERSLTLLGSPPFLVAVVLLLANDFVLKQQFHNSVTGKLSDVAGLFAFALFWSAILPQFRVSVLVLIAAGFVFWKSPYAQPLIDGWNRVAPFAVARTVDWTDLCALLVLPMAYLYNTRTGPRRIHRPLLYGIAAVSLFAFTATSFSKRTAFNAEYLLPLSGYSFNERMKRWSDTPHKLDTDREYLIINFDDCNETAYVGVAEVNGQAKVRLWLMNNRCPRGGDPAKMQKFFEQNFIDPLKAPDQASSPSKVMYIRRIEMKDIPEPDKPR
jgi:hypothetical protein